MVEIRAIYEGGRGTEGVSVYRKEPWQGKPEQIPEGYYVRQGIYQVDVSINGVTGANQLLKEKAVPQNALYELKVADGGYNTIGSFPQVASYRLLEPKDVEKTKDAIAAQVSSNLLSQAQAGAAFYGLRDIALSMLKSIITPQKNEQIPAPNRTVKSILTAHDKSPAKGVERLEQYAEQLAQTTSFDIDILRSEILPKHVLHHILADTKLGYQNYTNDQAIMESIGHANDYLIVHSHMFLKDPKGEDQAPLLNTLTSAITFIDAINAPAATLKAVKQLAQIIEQCTEAMEQCLEDKGQFQGFNASSARARA